VNKLERILKALANKRRLAILKYLKQERVATVADIAGKIRLSFKSTSRHLAVLRLAEIVEGEQRSLRVFYRISANQEPATRYIISLI